MRAFIVLSMMVALALASPMEKVKRDTDVELIRPIEGDDVEDDMGDDEFYGMDNPRFFPSNFYDIFDQVNQMANRFRMWLSNRRPFFNNPSFFNNGLPGNLPPNYDNSTFSTKVVNGSVITVNETIHKVSNNDSSFVFHTKVVLVRPENETAVEDSEVFHTGTRKDMEHTTTERRPEDDTENDISSVPRVRRAA